MSLQEAKAANADREIKADLDRLVALVEASRVEDARELSSELARKWPDSRPVQHLCRVLQPPRVLSGGGLPVRSFQQEFAWIRGHAHEYPGCWLAIHGDRLVAAGASRREVVSAAREALGEARALLFFQPADSK